MTKRNSGFTLTEILIVIGLIVLILGIAVMALPYMTSANSIEAAYNTMSAYLGRVRQDGPAKRDGIYAYPNYGAVGVFFYENEGRVNLVQITYDEDTLAQWDVEMMEDRDRLVLQPGVSVGLINDITAIGATTRYTNSGVIMFDRHGKMLISRYEILPNVIPGFAGQSQKQTQFGFALYERDAYASAVDSSFSSAVDQDGDGDVDSDDWIDQYALPIMVNRLNGTLIKGE